MKRTNKKLLAVFLAAILILTQLAIPAAAEYDTANATSFTFTDGAIAVTEGAYSGYQIEGTALTVNGSGTYVLSGSCADGSIKVKKGTTGVVLILNGLTLASADTAPICCNKSSEVTIVAAAGSVNTLTDSEKNNDETHTENENAENAVIKAKDGARLTLCGTGTIRVTANGKNGVKGGATTESEGAASLTVKELTLEITANVDDGLKSDQELNILSGKLIVSAADDAIKSDLVLNIGAEGTAGPTIRIDKSSEGIEAATVNIYSGDITVHADDDGVNAANSDLTNYSYACNIHGGSLYIDVAKGDAIDSNGSLTITGGTVEVHSAAAGQDGSPLDCEGQMTVAGGTVLAVGNSGMAQTPNGTTQTYVVFGSSGMGGMNGMGGMIPPGIGNSNGMIPPGMGSVNSEMPNGTQAGGSSVTIAAGDTISVADENGNTLCTTKALRTANYVFFSSGSLTAGKTYTLIVNGSVVATATAGTTGSTSAGGMMRPNMGNVNGMTSPGTGKANGMTLPEAGTANGGNAAIPNGGNAQNPIPFKDVQESDFFAEPVAWALRSGVTTGADAEHFLPEEECTRAQTMTFLWRALGSPETSSKQFFTDVSPDSYYAKAVAWAAANSIANGTGTGSFSPEAGCTRAQVVTFLWRAAGSPEVNGSQNFTDVSPNSYYAKAVAWAVTNGITNGTGAGRFSPDDPVTRAQTVTFLGRYAGKTQTAANS